MLSEIISIMAASGLTVIIIIMIMISFLLSYGDGAKKTVSNNMKFAILPALSTLSPHLHLFASYVIFRSCDGFKPAKAILLIFMMKATSSFLAEHRQK